MLNASTKIFIIFGQLFSEHRSNTCYFFIVSLQCGLKNEEIRKISSYLSSLLLCVNQSKFDTNNFILFWNIGNGNLYKLKLTISSHNCEQMFQWQATILNWGAHLSYKSLNIVWAGVVNVAYVSLCASECMWFLLRVPATG